MLFALSGISLTATLLLLHFRLRRVEGIFDDETSLARFRRHLATIERERAERQRVDLEADMKGRG